VVPMNIPASHMTSFWDVLRASHTFLGCSVTYPHKQSAYTQVDTMTARATRLGALNTVRREADGSLCGDATDGAALLRAIAINGACVQIMGAGGGAGRAIIDALCDAGAAQLILNDADDTRLAQTVSLVQQFWPNTLLGGAGCADILIDATPNGKNASAAPLFAPKVVSACKVVCDITNGKNRSRCSRHGALPSCGPNGVSVPRLSRAIGGVLKTGRFEKNSAGRIGERLQARFLIYCRHASQNATTSIRFCHRRK